MRLLPTAAPGERKLHPNLLLAILCLSALSLGMQQTMVIPALPTLREDLHASTGWSIWVVTAFLITSSVAAPVVGRLGDQFGRRRMLLLSLAVLGIGSAGAAAAWNIWALIGFRALGGLGGALFPLCFSIAKEQLPSFRVPIALAVISAFGGGGGALGVGLAGLLVDKSWRLLFAAGAVVIAATLVLSQWFVPESSYRASSKVDYLGAALLSGTLICLLVGLTTSESLGWSSPWIIALLLASIVLAVTFARVERRSAAPMVDMQMLKHRPIFLTNAVTLAHNFAVTSTFILVPILLQAPRVFADKDAHLATYGFNASTTSLSMYMIIVPLALLPFSPLAGLLGRSCGAKWPLALGLTSTALATGFLATWHDRPWQVAFSMLLLGIGIAAYSAAAPKLITDAAKPTELGIATGMSVVMRTVGGAFGAQIGAVILAAFTIGSTNIPSESGFVTVFWLSCIVAIVGLVGALLIKPSIRPLAVPQLSFERPRLGT